MSHNSEIKIRGRGTVEITGGRGPVGASSVESDSWIRLASEWSDAPSFNADISGGSVYNYTYNAITRYRFVPSPYDPLQDSFYSSFDGSSLSGLISARY